MYLNYTQKISMFYIHRFNPTLYYLHASEPVSLLEMCAFFYFPNRQTL